MLDLVTWLGKDVLRDTPKYVAGFLFGLDYKKVVLIKKNKPLWQQDKINAIGGKIEEGETASQAMVRECREECGVAIDDWRLFCITYNPVRGGIVYFFTSRNAAIKSARSKEAEQIIVIDTVDAHKFNCLANIEYLMYMAMDRFCSMAYIIENQ